MEKKYKIKVPKFLKNIFLKGVIFMEKLYKEYINFNFESSSGLTPEFRSFATKLKRRLTKAVEKEGLQLVDFSRGHFYCSGFAFNPVTGKYAYFNTGDVRWGIMGKPLEQCLVRTAKNSKDYTGGQNHHCHLPDIVEWLTHLTA